MTYRNRRLLDLAHRVTECQIRIPGVCVGHSPEGCEPAHSNQINQGKGIGIKAPDFMVAAGCHPCHVAIDSGKHLSKDDRQYYWQKGFERTLGLYFENGWLTVK